MSLVSTRLYRSFVRTYPSHDSEPHETHVFKTPEESIYFQVAINASISSTVRGRSCDRSSAPVSVTATPSSIRTWLAIKMEYRLINRELKINKDPLKDIEFLSKFLNSREIFNETHPAHSSELFNAILVHKLSLVRILVSCLYQLKQVTVTLGCVAHGDICGQGSDKKLKKCCGRLLLMAPKYADNIF